MWKFVFKFVLYFVFVLFLVVVCYGGIGSDRFRLNKNMEDIFNVKFDKVGYEVICIFY